jgi:hypothetical protein
MPPVAVAIPFAVPVAFMEDLPIYPHNKYITSDNRVLELLQLYASIY